MIVNAVGLDRQGIVSDMTKHITDAGGNVGQSQAAKLGNYFSIMMQIEVPSQELDSLKKNLTNMPGMNASIFEVDEKPQASSRPIIACKQHLKVMLLFLHHGSTHSHSPHPVSLTLTLVTRLDT